MTKYLLFWFPMLLIAVVNGMLREFVLKKYMAGLQAHQFSTLTLIVLVAFYIGFIVRRFPPVSSGQALLIGVIWMIMTLAFEFGFGLYRGNSIPDGVALISAEIGEMKGELCVCTYIFFFLNDLMANMSGMAVQSSITPAV